MTNSNDFLPADYSQPNASENYMKFQKGENKFRILGKPIMGWQDWEEKKPLRFPMNQKPQKSIDPKQPVKHFWAFPVFNYSETKVQILEVTQATVQAAITALSKDSDWGSVYDYDIKVTKTGEGMGTEYNTTPSPKKPLPEEIKAEYASKNINLNALFENGDPFANSANGQVKKDDLPF